MEPDSLLLQKLDDSVWVKKRLSPCRLIILDEINQDERVEKFFYSLHAVFYLGTHWIDGLNYENIGRNLKDEQNVNFLKEAIWVLNNNSPNNIYHAFLIDLKTYGLREALAYLPKQIKSFKIILKDELSNPMITAKFEEFIIKCYSDIGMSFLQNSIKIEKRISDILKKYKKKKFVGNMNDLDKLVIVDAISFN